MKMFDDAVEQYGTVEYPTDGRWMLPDGTVLAYDDDHRCIGHLCPDGNWLTFIEKGACSLHVSCEYVHIRTTGLTTMQRVSFQNLYESGLLFEPMEARIELFEGRHREDVLELDDAGEIRLYLTDTIAYRIYLNEKERMT